MLVVSGCTVQSNATHTPLKEEAKANHFVAQEKLTQTALVEYPYYETPRDLYNSADVIALVTVKEVASKELNISANKQSPHYLVYTVSRVKADQIIKGDKEKTEFSVKQLGGDDGKTQLIVDNMIYLEKDKQYLLFLESYPDDKPMALLNPKQAFIEVSGDAIVYKDPLFPDLDRDDFMEYIAALPHY